MWRARRRVLCTTLLCIAALWAMPRGARAQLYIVQESASTLPTGSAGEYNATTGAVIDANFITGLNAPYELALATGITVSGVSLRRLDTYVGSKGGHCFERKAPA